jgi:hypothetical protein
VNVRTIEVVRGTDSKLYPARQLAEAELRRIRGLAHALHCRDGLSIRGVQQVLAESYAVRRSVGVIYRDLIRFTCQLPRCPGLQPPPDLPQQPGQPEPVPAGPEPVRSVVHQGEGGLTGMVRDG